MPVNPEQYAGPTTPKGHPRKRMCHHCRQRKTYPMFRRVSKGISPICQECEKEGWKFCRLCKQAKLAQDFPSTAEGKTKAHCWACTRRRSGTRSPRKVRRQVTDADEKFILKIWEETHNKMEVARRSGFARNTVIAALNRIHSDPAIMAAKWTPPDPRAYDDLSDDAKRGLEDFMFFSSRYLGLDFDPWVTGLVGELMQAYESEVDEYLDVNVAYGAGKSTVVTRAFPEWVICRERALAHEPTISLGHRAENRAKWYLQRIRQDFTQNRDLMDAYGRFKPDNKGATPWSVTEILVEPLDWSTLQEKEPTIAVSSYEGAIMSGHFKIVIWDDLVDEKNSLTADQRTKLEETYDGTFESRLQAGGVMALVGARFGPEDLHHHVMADEYEDELDSEGRAKKIYRRIIYKAHYEEMCTGQHGAEAKPYPEGCMLSPTRVPWFRIKKAMKRERRFRLSYQQEDVAGKGTLAQPVWFEGGEDTQGWRFNGCFNRSLTFGRRLTGHGETALSAITVDPSDVKYWAVQHFLVYATGQQHLYRAARRPMQAPDLLYRERDGRYTGLLEDWWQLASKDGVPPRYLIVEARGVQKWLGQYEFARSWCMERGVTLIPHDTNRVNKHDEHRGVEMTSPIYREGRLTIPYLGEEERYVADTFKREATSWPEGSTNDLVMGHWFLTHQLPNLLAASHDEPDEDIHRPTWAEVKRPEFADNVYAGR